MRFLTELAWQQHFVTNMFIRPNSKKEIEGFKPQFTIINACKVVDEKWKQHNINSEVFVAFNLEKQVAIIGGTWYGGEMKKGEWARQPGWQAGSRWLVASCGADSVAATAVRVA